MQGKSVDLKLSLQSSIDIEEYQTRLQNNIDEKSDSSVPNCQQLCCYTSIERQSVNTPGFYSKPKS